MCPTRHIEASASRLTLFKNVCTSNQCHYLTIKHVPIYIYIYIHIKQVTPYHIDHLLFDMYWYWTLGSTWWTVFFARLRDMYIYISGQFSWPKSACGSLHITLISLHHHCMCILQRRLVCLLRHSNGILKDYINGSNSEIKLVSLYVRYFSMFCHIFSCRLYQYTILITQCISGPYTHKKLPHAPLTYTSMLHDEGGHNC